MKPRIAFFDIENAPSLGYYYEPYLRHAGRNIISTVEPWFMLSFSWQWLGEKTVHCAALPDFPIYQKNKRDDSALVKKLWDLFNEADILIAHNGDKFDTRKANARFLQVVGTPPSPYKTIDTLKIARKHFMLESNRLGDLGEFFGVGRKLETSGWDTWRRCIDGDVKAWALMKRYNKQDVALLAKVYDKLKAWGKHPDLTVWTKTGDCPTCLSSKVEKRGTEMTKGGVKQRFHCDACGGWFSRKVAA